MTNMNEEETYLSLKLVEQFLKQAEMSIGLGEPTACDCGQPDCKSVVADLRCRKHPEVKLHPRLAITGKAMLVTFTCEACNDLVGMAPCSGIHGASNNPAAATRAFEEFPDQEGN